MNTLKATFCFSLLFFLMNCNEPKIIDIQGHRGCRGLMPENTMEAFKKAIELGVQTLELDVVVSKDNTVIVSHEPFMNSVICLDINGLEIPKTDEEKYNLYQMTFDSIKQFDCGTKHHPRFPNQQKIKTYKPALSEVIKASKLLNQLVLAYGERRTISDREVILFPTPEIVANASLDELKMPGARKLALNALGEFVKLKPDSDLNDWLSIKGIGPWTIAYAKMRGESHPDILLCGDLVVKKRVLALYQQYQQDTGKTETLDYDALTKEIAKTVSPWGSYLTFQLWNLS